MQAGAGWGLDPMGISLLVRWLIGWALMARAPGLPDLPVQGTPRVSLLIPARNEARALPHLLEALGRQRLKPDELLVIDDQSSDGTAAIARAGGATVVTSPELPRGWTGKNWALHTGVQQTSGEILVFLDADTEPAPELLHRLVAAVQQGGGLVSVQPYHRTERPYERLSILFNLLGLMGVTLGRGGGVAFGPAMATSRVDYERSGGHASVAGHVVEDWFVAHAYQAAGLPTSAYVGWQQLNYRMYPGGLMDLIHGFDKNFATAAGEVSWPRMLAVVLWLSALFWAAWCLPASLLGLPVLGDPPLAASALLYLAFALQLTMLVRRVGNFGLSGLLFPVPVLFFLVVFIRAILNLRRGGIEWKGRQVDTHLEQR